MGPDEESRRRNAEYLRRAKERQGQVDGAPDPDSEGADSQGPASPGPGPQPPGGSSKGP